MPFLLVIAHHLIELSDRDASPPYIPDIKRVKHSGKSFKIFTPRKFLNVVENFFLFPAGFRIKGAPLFTFVLFLFDVPCYFIAIH